MKRKKICSLILGAALMFNIFSIKDVVLANTTNYKELPSVTVNKDKEFTITFNKEINKTTINKNTIKVIDSKGTEVDVNVSTKVNNDKAAIVVPPFGGYTEGETYSLIVKQDIMDLKSTKLQQETLMEFIVNGSTGGTDNNTQKDNMEIILSNYRGGKVYSPYTQFLRAKDVFNEYTKDPAAYEKYIVDYFTKPLYKDMPTNVWEWYADVQSKGGEYTKIRNDFNKKYLNEKYADITDINYFTKMKTNLDFTKVNNSDIVPKGSYSNSSRFLNGEVMMYALEGANQSKDIRLQYIWRPDVESKLLTLLNAERKKYGLEEFTLNNDLKAMAMYSTKKHSIYNLCNQSEYTNYTPILGGNTTGIYNPKFDTFTWIELTHEKLSPVLEPNHMESNVTGRVGGGYVAGYIPVDFVPLTNKNSTYENSTDFDNVNYETIFDGEKIYLPLTELGKKLGYKNYSSLVAIADGNGYIDSAEDIMNVWHDRMGYNFRETNGFVGIAKPTGSNWKENAKLLNPKLKQIGIAISYSIPKIPLEGQGIMNVYIIFSE